MVNGRVRFQTKLKASVRLSRPPATQRAAGSCRLAGFDQAETCAGMKSEAAPMGRSLASRTLFVAFCTFSKARTSI
jgi:hypothetical protein